GIVPSVLMPILAGGSVRLMPRFDPGEVLRVLREETIALATLVPSMIAACLAEPDLRRLPPGRLGCLYYGASPIDEGTLRAAAGAFGCDLVQSYGLTEATQALTLLTPADHRLALSDRPGLLGSAGRAVAATELRVVDADGAPVEPGTPGELLARGPQLMRGDLDDPVRTEAALAGGW